MLDQSPEVPIAADERFIRLPEVMRITGKESDIDLFEHTTRRVPARHRYWAT